MVPSHSIAAAAPAPEAPAGLAQQLAAHEGLVRWVVRQQWLGGLPFDDALHEGRLGLWRALEGYDPTQGTRFSTYAVPAIRRAVWRAVARHQPAAPRPHAHPVPPAGAGDDVVDRLHAAAVHAEVQRLVDQLPPRLRQVITGHYGLAATPPQSFAALGQALGVTRQRVQQLHVVALLWLAHPAHSLGLRVLLGRARRRDYQQALTRQRRWARARRRRRARRPEGRP